MSVWTTKALSRDREYVVIKHALPNANATVFGVKFRGGYGVVEKNSKTYYKIKQMPLISGQEFPLTFLKKLPFVTRSADVKLIYGVEVYSKYTQALVQELQQVKLDEQKTREEQIQLRDKIFNEIKLAKKHNDEEKVEELKQQLPTIEKCAFKLENGVLCGLQAVEWSPSNYCGTHSIEDPKLEELGIKRPRFMTKKQKREFRDQVREILEKVTKKGS